MSNIIGINSSTERSPAGLLSPITSVKVGKRPESRNVRYPFWFGGSASCIAACVTHPLDLLKVRLQMRTLGTFKSLSSTVTKIFQNEGLLGFYTGITASLLRQMTYATVRFGVYEEMKQWTGSHSSFPLLMTMASFSGFLGGIAGNFADVLNIRMQHDAALPVHERRQYKHAVDGMIRMARDEGLRSWFRGWVPNSSRAAVQTASQLVSYDVAKCILQEHTPMGDGVPTQLTASFLAGLTAATVTGPIDVIKTRVMTSAQKQPVLRLIKNISYREGPGWMFKGWLPSFLRLGPHTICIFSFLEMHRKVYREVQGLEKREWEM